MPEKDFLPLAAQRAEHDDFYGYEEEPNESQRALQREDWLHTSVTELLHGWRASREKKKKLFLRFLLFFFISSPFSWIDEMPKGGDFS